MKEIFDALGLTPDGLHLTGAEHLPSAFEVTELIASAQGAVGVALADLVASWGLGSRPADVRVDRRLASLWCASSIRPEGWEMPPVWDAVAGDYKARDGWIRLHTNAPHHREAALHVLDVAGERDAVAEAVSTWNVEALEAAVVDAGGAAAAMRSAADWADHPQGRAVAAEPLVAFEGEVAPTLGPAMARPDRPLAGLKVLDLTRVLAGPVATRALAGFGAEVLRIDPPDFDEPTLAPDVTLGKACARLDLRHETDRTVFERLLPEADLLVHGYRPGALEGLGYGAEARAAMNPALREVTLDAYGWSGPWAMRRGFDSLVQMSCGIAHAGMAWAGRDRPTPLPVQALDHATGYLMAAAALRLFAGTQRQARLSLARTAELLKAHPQEREGTLDTTPADADLGEDLEHTAWGDARRLRPAIDVAGVEMRWDRPAEPQGTSAATWPSDAGGH
ncbi:CAIB/BAIF family CoA transferase [Roseivivax halodurans JCM 10272]|uniref:CAIB/BAIF family CoA transferase n=1 Tax=Roseivivax halodurans JCM 10272 TaxID=1449350 RepID=X7EM12_9RHOB|nr:CoA transferase [Roseivivax halodurans]ETX16221.1 CAIB/BAIF family CoA transferase [Roseivivax halodurans JCM 10272]